MSKLDWDAIYAEVKDGKSRLTLAHLAVELTAFDCDHMTMEGHCFECAYKLILAYGEAVRERAAGVADDFLCHHPECCYSLNAAIRSIRSLNLEGI